MPNSTPTKTCTKCHEVKPLADFNKQASTRDGHQYRCRECHRAICRKSSPGNAEKIASRMSQWRRENIEHRRAYKAAYRAANPEKSKAEGSKYYANNAEIKREKAKAFNEAWRKANPDKVNAKEARRRALKLSAFVEDVSLDVVIEIHGASCVVCKSGIDLSLRHPHPMSKSLEHVIPLARGGEHSYENCAPSHLRCNLSKGVKPLNEVSN